MEIEGRVALVTGASSGIGAATALALARAGATVIAAARRADRLEEVVARCREHAPDSEVRALDVSDRAACEAAVAAIEEQHGHLDIVVNNAGIPMRRHAAVLTVDDVETVMAVNFRGPAVLTLAALPGMRARGEGAIVNVTSVSAGIPVPRAAAYGASKAALTRFAHGLSIDLAGSGVQVAVVSPGPIATEIWDRGDERNSYRGRTYPPEVVADRIVASIRDGAVHRTAPRRYGALGAVYALPLVGTVLRWGLRRSAPPADWDGSHAVAAKGVDSGPTGE